MSSDTEVWRQLLELTGPFSTYALSFIALGTFWIAHHSLINLLLISLISLLQVSYLAQHPELSHDQLTPSWIANVRRRTSIPIIIVDASITISFYQPNFAMSAYWLLLVFHFLPGRHHRPPEVGD